MDIDVDELGDSGADFDRVYEAGEISLGEEQARLLEGPEIHLHAVRAGEQIRIRGTLVARIEVDCDRCLKTVEVSVNPDVDVVYAPIQTIEVEGAHEVAGDELDFSFYKGSLISIEDLIREQIFLALPTRFLCTETCKGLCPDCGADKNGIDNCGCQDREIDPRWSALKNLN